MYVMKNSLVLKKMRVCVAGLLAGGACWMIYNCGFGAEPGGTSNQEIAALRAEVERLKGMMPDQSHAMKDVGYHFANLWFAGKKQNWSLARFYLDETRSHLRWAVRI